MKQSLRSVLVIVALLTVSLPSTANGDPVTRYSSIHRLGNPEPLAIPEIRIMKENLVISHEDGYNCFDISYKMKNTADTAIQDIDYGFPIDYTVRDEQESYYMADSYITESSYDVGWNEKLIKDVSFSINGHQLPFEVSKTSVFPLKSEIEDFTDDYSDTLWCDGINRRWFYTRFTLPPDSVVELNVKYKVYASSVSGRFENLAFKRFPINSDADFLSTSSLSRYLLGTFQILYDFTPAKYFGNGRSFPIDVEIDLSNLKNPKDLNDPEKSVSQINKRFDFDGNKNLYLDEFIIYEKDDYRKELEKFMVDPSVYKIKAVDGITTIEFDHPANVTDIVCEVDDPQLRTIVGQVVYADGKVSTYLYERQDEPNFWSRKLDPTVVLVINDFYGADSCYRSGKDDTIHYIQSDSGVTTIRFFHGSTPLRNIRPLDARFIGREEK